MARTKIESKTKDEKGKKNGGSKQPLRGCRLVGFRRVTRLVTRLMARLTP